MHRPDAARGRSGHLRALAAHLFSHGRPDAGHGGGVLHRPRLYDWGVRFMTLGRDRRAREKVLELAELAPGQSVLDVGCGTGTLLVAAARRVGPAGRVHGVEPSPEMLARARHKARKAALDVQLEEAPAEALPLPDGSVDVVLCTLVLHHLAPEARGHAIGEMRRVLRPGGRIAVMEIARPSSLVAALTPISLLHGLARHGGHGGHGMLVDVPEALEEAGFRDLTTQEIGSGLGVTVGLRPPSA